MAGKNQFEDPYERLALYLFECGSVISNRTKDNRIRKIDAKINRLVDLRAAINAAIESMENPEERLLLKYRYLKNESWEDISYELNVSYRTVHRIHASALNNFVLPE